MKFTVDFHLNKEFLVFVLLCKKQFSNIFIMFCRHRKLFSKTKKILDYISWIFENLLSCSIKSCEWKKQSTSFHFSPVPVRSRDNNNCKILWIIIDSGLCQNVERGCQRRCQLLAWGSCARLLLSMPNFPFNSWQNT